MARRRTERLDECGTHAGYGCHLTLSIFIAVGNILVTENLELKNMSLKCIMMTFLQIVNSDHDTFFFILHLSSTPLLCKDHALRLPCRAED
jgi:hypothetical protein